MKVLTNEQMRIVEGAFVEAGGSYLWLMENAGHAVFRGMLRHENSFSGKSCIILCGNGNNGGDGFVVARYLAESGANVICILINGMPKSKQSLEMYDRLLDAGVTFYSIAGNKTEINMLLKKSNIIVDAMFGIGFKGVFPEDVSFLAQSANKSRARVYSIDIPSGINSDTGAVCENAVEAYATFVIGTFKYAHVMHYEKDYLGILEVLDIGLPEVAYDAIDCHTYSIDRRYVYSRLKKRSKYSNKGDHGKLLCISGSMGMSGSAKLVAQSAYRSGAGYVYLACPKSIVTSISSALTEPIIVPLPETMVGSISATSILPLLDFVKHTSACVIGPGLRNNQDTVEITKEMIKNSRCPLIIDADGINAVASDIDILWARKSDIVLTPHPGEMGKLIDKSPSYVNSNRIEIAREFAQKYGVVLVLKGTNTIVASSKGEVYISMTGNAGLAKAGSGDILTGLIGSLVAQGYKPIQASIMGVFLHGLAADYTAARLSFHSMMASDVLDDYHVVFKECDR